MRENSIRYTLEKKCSKNSGKNSKRLAQKLSKQTTKSFFCNFFFGFLIFREMLEQMDRSEIPEYMQYNSYK